MNVDEYQLSISIYVRNIFAQLFNGEIGLTLQKVVQTSVSGDLQFGSYSEHGALRFGELNGSEDSLIVSLRE